MQVIAITAALILIGTASECPPPPTQGCRWATIELLSPECPQAGSTVRLRASCCLPLTEPVVWEVQVGHWTYEPSTAFQACAPRHVDIEQVVYRGEVDEDGWIRVQHGFTVMGGGWIFPLYYDRTLTCSSGDRARDIMAVMSYWGARGEVPFLPADFTLDGVVNAEDLLWAVSQ